MEKRVYILITALMATICSYGAAKKAKQVSDTTQTVVASVVADKEMSTADSLYKCGKYSEAIKLYKEKLTQEPHNPRLNYMVGACLFYSNDINSAEYYLTDAQELPGAMFMKGDIHMKQYEFDQAKACYEKALRMAGEKSYLHDACSRRLLGVENAKNMMRRVEKVIIMDSLTVSKKFFFNYYGLSENAGTLYEQKKNETEHSTPYTGYMNQREDRQIFADTTGGGVNLWVKDKLIDGWSKERKLPNSINTDGEENFPYLQEDGLTLYFGSTRHGSIGGYDLFVARFNPDHNGYMTPMQLSMPFNSTWNDYLMAIDENSGIGYWATDRWMKNDSVKVYSFKAKGVSEFIHDSVEGEKRLEYAMLKRYSTYEDEVEIKTEAETPKDTVAATEKNDTIIEALPKMDEETAKIEIAASGFEFKINDEITYTRLDDFISGEAKAYYQQGAKLQAEREANIAKLEVKRKEYAATTDATEKKKITAEILRIEKRLGAGAKTVTDKYFKLTRNFEIRAINNKAKQKQQ